MLLLQFDVCVEEVSICRQDGLLDVTTHHLSCWWKRGCPARWLVTLLPLVYGPKQPEQGSLPFGAMALRHVPSARFQIHPRPATLFLLTINSVSFHTAVISFDADACLWKEKDTSKFTDTCTCNIISRYSACSCKHVDTKLQVKINLRATSGYHDQYTIEIKHCYQWLEWQLSDCQIQARALLKYQLFCNNLHPKSCAPAQPRQMRSMFVFPLCTKHKVVPSRASLNLQTILVVFR